VIDLVGLNPPARCTQRLGQAGLAAVRDGMIRRLIVNLRLRHLNSLLASIAFPAWCLRRQPGTQILFARRILNAPLRRLWHGTMSKPRNEFAVSEPIGGKWPPT
jgi:hypothetical protein